MLIDPFHLVSTPVPVLPNLGLRTSAGLSGEDPSGRRHAGVGFSVWLTVYSPEGLRVRRTRLEDLPAGARRFVDVSELTADLGYRMPYLCVVHRVPDWLEPTEKPVEPPPGRDLDFDMYRTVLQLEHPGGGRGSVIYETPPHFNANPKKLGSFLSFSNQVQTGDGLNTYVVLLNYSITPAYSTVSRRRILLYKPDGAPAAESTRDVPAFTADVTDCAVLVRSSGQYSFVACSAQSSMIPLIINVSEKLGGVSVEHTHPPLSYLNMPAELGNGVRQKAIEHYLCAKL